MKTFEIDADDFSAEVFGVLEAIQDGKYAHRVTFSAANKEEAVNIVAERLKSFIESQMSQVFEA